LAGAIFMVNLAPFGLKSEDIIDFLKQQKDFPELLRNFFGQQIIKKFAQNNNITLTLEEIQRQCTDFRSEHDLENSSDFITWLAERGISYQTWEQTMSDRLLGNKVAEHLFSSQVESYFLEHQEDFEKILLYQIVVPFERIANDLFYQIEEQELSFFEAAHLYDLDQRRRLICGYEGWIPLSELPPEFIDPILNGNLGELISPIKTAAGYHLLLVEEVKEAKLTPEIRTKILNHLFEDWLKVEVNYHLQELHSLDSSKQMINKFHRG
jgi:parvulin-like peptidyl-prolyl isomerase